MTTSGLFTIPICYGIMKRKYALSAVTTTTMICSIVYWHKPEEENYRKADLIISKLSGFIYFLYGFYNIKSQFGKMIGYTNMTLMLNCYNASCIFGNLNSSKWIYFHMSFHIFTILGKLLVIEFSE